MNFSEPRVSSNPVQASERAATFKVAACSSGQRLDHVLEFRHRPVISSNIRSIAWTNGLLEVRFHSGGLYLYTGVPYKVARNFRRSRSKGKWFHKRFLGKYNYQKLETT